MVAIDAFDVVNVSTTRVESSSTVGPYAYFALCPGPTPSDLTATPVNTTRINLSWTDNTSGETGFKIERCTGSGCADFTEIATVGTNVRTYSDTTVCNSTTYNYQVKAYKSGEWETDYSNIASATIPTPVAPSLVATAVTDDTRIDLLWTDNTTDETGFKIERCIGVGCTSFAEIATVGANVTTYQDTGLSNSTTYRYRVKAYKTATCGWEILSNEAEATATPATPINLTATALNSRSIRLDWIDGSPDEDGFEIEVQLWHGGFAQTATVGANITTFTDTIGIEPQKEYRYRVRAYRGPDKSHYSNEAVATTPPWAEGHDKCPPE